MIYHKVNIHIIINSIQIKKCKIYQHFKALLVPSSSPIPTLLPAKNHHADSRHHFIMWLSFRSTFFVRDIQIVAHSQFSFSLLKICPLNTISITNFTQHTLYAQRLCGIYFFHPFLAVYFCLFKKAYHYRQYIIGSCFFLTSLTVLAFVLDCVLSHFNCVPTLCDPMDHSPPGSSAHGISLERILEKKKKMKEYQSGLPCPPPGDLPLPRIKFTSPASPVFQEDSLPAEPFGEALILDYLAQ